jgi:hypothetical protein
MIGAGTIMLCQRETGSLTPTSLSKMGAAMATIPTIKTILITPIGKHICHKRGEVGINYRPPLFYGIQIGEIYISC